MRKQKKKGRIILSLMLVLFLITSANSSAFAATARATTMKLEKTEGTVKVKTQNGAARKISNGMRLYNGNSVETATDSYAFISLDSSKAVKLSENAKASLRQNGKKLELLVKKGQLFFNVSTKLKDDESMNIRTSTMVTGIRGTCGIVEYVSAKTSKLYLLEGKVVLGGGSSPVTIHGGESAVIHTAQIADEKIAVSKMKETEIPIFAVEEVLKDPVLQKKIETNTDLRVEKMEEAFESASKDGDETENSETSEKPEESEKPTEPEAPIQPSIPINPSSPVGPSTPTEPQKPSEENPPKDDTGDNGDTGDTGETNPPKDDTGDTGDTGNNGDTGDAGDSSDENETEPPTEPVIPEEPEPGATLTEAMEVGDIETALSGNSVVKISQTGTVDMVKQTLTIPTGKTLIIDTVFSGSESTGYKGFYMVEESKIIVEPNATLYINGNIMGGIIELKDGTLYNKGTIDGQAMTASGKSKIINRNIIKLQQAFTKLDDDTQVDYQGSSESVFISNLP